MKAIEKKMIEAIEVGREFYMANTMVCKDFDGGMSVYLFGNLICKIDRDGGRTYTDAGWNTMTTRSRLNALGAGVKSVRGELVNLDGSALIPSGTYLGGCPGFVAK